MANEISLVTASGRTVTPKDDGIIYEVFSPGNGIIYGGAVTIKDSSTLHIAAGHGIVCGRKFTIDDSDIPVALSGSGSLLGRLYIHLDLADAADPITLLVETDESLTPVVQDSDVNINNGVYEINIATFDVDTVTISNLVDVAPYLNTNGYEHEQINNKLGNTDISGIGDGSVTGAISELNSEIADLDKGSVSYNYTTSQTWAQVLAALEAAADLTKITAKAALSFGAGYANRVGHLYQIGTIPLFTYTQVGSTSLVTLEADLANNILITGTVTSGNFAYANKSTSNPTANGTITLYY